MSLQPGSRLGQYEIVSPLGAGGMGEVYRARDVRLGREVALKVLPEEVSLDRDRLARFEQEARAASALNHPNIVTIHDIGQSESVSYIAMELVEGQTLREIVVEGATPLKRILSIAPQVAEGLAKAHAAGIVHRDLKPENLMVTKDGYVKILDFGLSKLAVPESGEVSAMPTLARPETHPGTVLGTVAYMSPEQASGRAVDYRSDQFSLGSILYEMAAGRKAFEGNSAAETMSTIIRDEPQPLARANPKTPPPLRWIVERCLAKDPEERYASTRDLARDLSGLRDHVSEASTAAEGVAAVPARRRGTKPVLAAAALVALGIAAGFLVSRRLPSKASSSPRFQQLTFRRGMINNARFTPDGQTVFYGATWVAEPQRLYATRLGSPESWAPNLGSGQFDILAVSPSGELAVLSYPESVLSRVPIAGGTPRQVVGTIPYAGADWAPDGKSLAIVHDVGRRRRLEFPIGKVLLETLILDPMAGIQGPRVSPRGDQVAYYNLAPGGVTLNLVDTSGSNRVLSSGWSEVAGVPCWTPDGREIWITARRGAEAIALHAVDLAGKVRLVSRIPGSLELDDISKDGRVLVGHHTVMQILMGRTPADNEERDLSWLDASSAADLSPDGKTLLFMEFGQGAGAPQAVYVRKTDGSAAVRLGEGRPLALSQDGSLVLACAESPGGLPRLTLLPTGPGEAKSLPNDRFLDIPSGQFLPDGRSIVFTASEKGRPARVYLQDLQGGREKPITPEGFELQGAAKRVSPDGKSVLAFSADGARALLFPVEGGEPRPVAGLNPGDRAVQWTADGRSLYVMRRQEYPVRVWLVDPAKGSRRLFKELRPPETSTGVWVFLVTPDGQSYVYSHQRAFSNLYVIDGLR